MRNIRGWLSGNGLARRSPRKGDYWLYKKDLVHVSDLDKRGGLRCFVFLGRNDMVVVDCYLGRLRATLIARHAHIEARIFKAVLFTLDSSFVILQAPAPRHLRPRGTGLISSSHGPTDSPLTFCHTTTRLTPVATPGRRSRAITAASSTPPRVASM